MRKAILMLLMAVVSSNAAAEWTKVVELEAGSLYVNPATIRSNGDLVETRTLYDLNTPVIDGTNGKPYVSQKVQVECDCNGKRWRVLEYFWFTGRMGEGQMVEYFSESTKLSPVPAGSAVEIVWKRACGMK
jgi:hypothetical protein